MAVCVRVEWSFLSLLMSDFEEVVHDSLLTLAFSGLDLSFERAAPNFDLLSCDLLDLDLDLDFLSRDLFDLDLDLLFDLDLDLDLFFDLDLDLLFDLDLDDPLFDLDLDDLFDLDLDLLLDLDLDRRSDLDVLEFDTGTNALETSGSSMAFCSC